MTDYDTVSRGIRYLMEGHADDRFTAKGSAQVATLRALAHFYAQIFGEQDPKFDTDKFLFDCRYFDFQLQAIATK